MPVGKRAIIITLAMALAMAPSAIAQTLKWGSDIKIVKPQKALLSDPDYITLETVVPLKGIDLFDYFLATTPNATFADFLKANPALGTIKRDSPIDAGTEFVVTRPEAIKSGE